MAGEYLSPSDPSVKDRVLRAKAAAAGAMASNIVDMNLGFAPNPVQLGEDAQSYAERGNAPAAQVALTRAQFAREDQAKAEQERDAYARAHPTGMYNISVGKVREVPRNSSVDVMGPNDGVDLVYDDAPALGDPFFMDSRVPGGTAASDIGPTFASFDQAKAAGDIAEQQQARLALETDPAYVGKRTLEGLQYLADLEKLKANQTYRDNEAERKTLSDIAGNYGSAAGDALRSQGTVAGKLGGSPLANPELTGAYKTIKGQTSTLVGKLGEAQQNYQNFRPREYVPSPTVMEGYGFASTAPTAPVVNPVISGNNIVDPTTGGVYRGRPAAGAAPQSQPQDEFSRIEAMDDKGSQAEVGAFLGRANIDAKTYIQVLREVSDQNPSAPLAKRRAAALRKLQQLRSPAPGGAEADFTSAPAFVPVDPSVGRRSAMQFTRPDGSVDTAAARAYLAKQAEAEALAERQRQIRRNRESFPASLFVE